MALVAITDIPALLRPGLAAITTNGPNYSNQWKEIFETRKSDKERELIVEVKSLGLASFKDEAASISYDGMQQTYTTVFVNRYVAIGFIITRQAIKDNLYQKDFPQQALALKRSLEVTKDTLGASVLNNAFDTNFPIGDGQPVCSLVHPIVGGPGTVANTFSVQVDLSEGSLEDMVIATQRFRSAAGLLEMNLPTKLIVPSNLQFTAERILKSQYRVGTANNDINAMYNVSAVPQGYRVNQYLTNQRAYFLLTNAQNGMIHFDREPVETDMFVEFDTKSVKASAMERYSFGVANFRAIFGSSGGS